MSQEPQAAAGSLTLPAPVRPRVPWLRQVAVLIKKDVLIESRSGELLVTSGFFAVLVVVLSSLAYYLGPTLRGQVAAGVMWVAIAFAAVLSLGKGWQREREHGAFSGVLVAPVARSAIFAAKATGLLLFLFVIEAVVIPTCALLFSLDLTEYGTGLVALALLATPGIAAAGTLFGVITVRTTARDLILAVVLFPLLAPTLVCAVVATRELFNGAPLSDLADFMTLLVTLDVVFIAGGVGMFGSLTEG